MARDGERVPYTVIRRKGTRTGRPHATLVSAYGAYQYSTTPRFSPTLLPFLDADGVYVNANVRGGGEYGREWHQAGKKASKPNTWRDLIDVCEMLVREHLTTPRQLAITGTSAGGIAVGRAMTERPDLFAAAISDVGPTRSDTRPSKTSPTSVNGAQPWTPQAFASCWRWTACRQCATACATRRYFA